MRLSTDGLLVNANAGFDARILRNLCELPGVHLNAPINPRSGPVDEFDQPYFDELRYQERFVVERTNAWMDAHRSLFTRFDTAQTSWMAWHDRYCVLTWCRRVTKV